MAPQEQLAFTIPQFCAAHSISRSLLYALWKENRGPQTMKLGGRRAISVESAAEWRRRMEAEADTPEADTADSQAA